MDLVDDAWTGAHYPKLSGELLSCDASMRRCTVVLWKMVIISLQLRGSDQRY